MLSQITPLILTYNESPNLERTLQNLDWAEQIVVIDSISTDGTLEILDRYPQVQVYKRAFDTHATQWNYGIERVTTPWVLSLDSDYVIPTDLVEELSQLQPPDHIDGYYIPFRYCVFGKPLRGTLLPPRQALFRRDRAYYIDDGHTQLLVAKGESASLKNPIHHDDRKPLSRWLWAQDRYMRLEVKKLNALSPHQLSLSDRARQTRILAPFLILFYCLILKGGILDGWRGWYYAAQRTLAELLLILHLIDDDLTPLKEENSGIE